MKSILIKNGLYMDMENGSLSKKDLFIQNGKIENLEDCIEQSTENTQVIDVKESYVYPEFIDCHTHMGIIEEGTGKLGIDNNECSNPTTPQLRAIDGINPLDIAFKDAVRYGITCVMSGQEAIIQLPE